MTVTVQVDWGPTGGVGSQSSAQRSGTEQREHLEHLGHFPRKNGFYPEPRVQVLKMLAPTLRVLQIGEPVVFTAAKTVYRSTVLVGCRSAQSADWQHAYPYPLGFDHNNRTASEYRGDLGEIRHQEIHLVCRFLRSCSAKKNDRWQGRFTQGKDRSKVGVRRHDHPLVTLGIGEDHLILGGCQPVIPYVGRIMTGLPKPLRHDWRKGVVDEEPHDAWSRGNSRSRTASAA